MADSNITDEELAMYSPEMLKQMFDAGMIDKKQARTALKLEAANQQRNLGAPQGTRTRAAYIAASPLSHLARGMRQYKGKKDAEGLEARQDVLDTEQAAARQAYFEGPPQAPGEAMYNQAPPPQAPAQSAGAQMAAGLAGQGAGPPPQAALPPQAAPPPQAQPPLQQPSPQINQPDPNLNPDPYAGSSVGVGEIPNDPAKTKMLAEQLRKMGINPVGLQGMGVY